jgi:hypothetical protein
MRTRVGSLARLTVVVPLLSSPALAATHHHRATRRAAPKTAREVTALKDTYLELLEAARTKDVPTLRQILADGYVQTLADGTTRTKEQRIRETVAPELVVSAVKLMAFDGAVHGDAGEARAEVEQTGTYGGQAFTLRVRAVVRFVRASGTWSIVSTRLTNVAAAASKTAPN